MITRRLAVKHYASNRSTLLIT